MLITRLIPTSSSNLSVTTPKKLTVIMSVPNIP